LTADKPAEQQTNRGKNIIFFLAKVAATTTTNINNTHDN